MEHGLEPRAELAAWRASRRAGRRYARTGNVLYAWQAAGIALGAGLPMPRAVHEYVVRAAAALGAPCSDRVSSPKARVFAALELGGPGPSVFERRRLYERDLEIQQTAALIRRTTRALRGDALEHAAEDAGLDADSIRRQDRRRTNPP